MDRVAVAMNRSSAETEVRLPLPRAGMAWRALIDTHDPEAPERPIALADRARLHARSSLILAEAPTASGGLRSGAPSLETIDKLATAAGIAAEWFDIAGKRTIVSPETKIALLSALGLEAASEAEARESLTRVVDETQRRRLPFSLVLRLGEPPVAPLRDMPRSTAARIEREDGAAVEWRVEAADGARRDLPDGRSVSERPIALPTLPIGRYRLIVDGVECALTIAPPEAYGPKAALRKRFGVAAQLYALRRTGEDNGDQGIGDFSTLALAGEKAGGAGAAYFGVSPLHMLFPRDRDRASPYYPSDRRFLDPIFIDALDDAGLPRDEALSAALAALAPAFAAASATKHVEYDAVWRAKRAALEAWSAAFARARAARPGDPLVADYRSIRDFGRRGVAALRRLPGDRRRRSRRGLAPLAARPARRRSEGDRGRDRATPPSLRVRPLLPMARRPPARASRGARAQRRLGDRVLSRSCRRRRAGRRRILGARRGLARGVTIGAPPDPFSAQGQNWSLPALNPLAGARDGWASLSAIYRANMRHAGMLRIDHAMGLERLFLIPEGARPAEGAYLSYPLDDLIGHIALESQRAQCMVVGEDLGTVPEGFRDRLTRANIHGHAGAVVRARRRRGAAAGRLSADVGRLRRDARSGDARRLVARRRHRRAALARPPDVGQGGRRRSPRGARRSAALSPRLLAAGLILVGAERRCAAFRRDRRRGPCADRRLGLDPRPRPVRRSRRRDGRDQPARNGPRAPELAPQGRPRRRRRLRQPSGAGDPQGAGQGADVTRRIRRPRTARPRSLPSVTSCVDLVDEACCPRLPPRLAFEEGRMAGDEILELPQSRAEMRPHRFRRAFRAPFGDRLKNRPVLAEGSLHAPRRGKEGSTHPIKMHAQPIERFTHARQA